MKRRHLIIIVIFFMSIFINKNAYAIGYVPMNGSINISGLNPLFVQKIMVEKDNQRLYYNITGADEIIPAQLGTGKYQISLLRHNVGNNYHVLLNNSVVVTSVEEVFLNSSQPVYWNEDDSFISFGRELTLGKETELDKVRAVYDYIVRNIAYDNDKIDGLNKSYIPDSEKTLKIKSGICYDYAALFAGILRSQEIPTKLVKGFKKDLNEYHAWNEVYIKGRWLTIDTTYNASVVQSGKNISMYKNPSDYTKTGEY